jgi:hypothetical protein
MPANDAIGRGFEVFALRAAGTGRAPTMALSKKLNHNVDPNRSAHLIISKSIH